MMTIVTHVHLREGTERDWDAAMRTRLSAARKASGWVGGQLLRPADKPDRRVIVGTWRPARTGRHGTMIRNSRRRVSGSTGWRARPPSTGGTTSCSMSGKPRRRPRQPPRLRASRGRRARRRAHEGPRLDDPALAAAAGGSGDRSMRTASGSRHTCIAPSEAVTVHQPSIRAREAAHDVVFDRRRSPDRRGGASQPIVRSRWTINHPENARTGTVATGSDALGTAVTPTTRDWRQPPGDALGPESRIRRSRSGRAASRRDGRASAGQGRPWPWADRVAEERRSNCV